MTRQGAFPRLVMAYPPGMAWGYLLKAALRLDKPSSYSLGSSMGQTLLHSPQLVHLDKSTKRGCRRSRALKTPGSPSRARTSVLVNISIFRCRPTSTSLGEIIHMAQSLVGKVLSNWDINPPIAEDCSTR